MAHEGLVVVAGEMELVATSESSLHITPLCADLTWGRDSERVFHEGLGEDALCHRATVVVDRQLYVGHIVGIRMVVACLQMVVGASPPASAHGRSFPIVLPWKGGIFRDEVAESNAVGRSRVIVIADIGNQRILIDGDLTDVLNVECHTLLPAMYKHHLLCLHGHV